MAWSTQKLFTKNGRLKVMKVKRRTTQMFLSKSANLLGFLGEIFEFVWFFRLDPPTPQFWNVSQLIHQWASIHSHCDLCTLQVDNFDTFETNFTNFKSIQHFSGPIVVRFKWKFTAAQFYSFRSSMEMKRMSNYPDKIANFVFQTKRTLIQKKNIIFEANDYNKLFGIPFQIVS